MKFQTNTFILLSALKVSETKAPCADLELTLKVALPNKNFIFALFLFSGLCVSQHACTKKTKSSGADLQPAAATSPATTPIVNATPSVTPQTTPLVNSPKSSEELALPPSNILPIDAQSLLLLLPEMSRVMHIWSLLPMHSAGLTLSDLETKAEICANETLSTVLVSATDTALTFTATRDFAQCVKNATPVLTTPEGGTWKASLNWAFKASCDNHPLKKYDTLKLTDSDFVRFLCFDATRGEIQGTMTYEVTEQNNSGATIRALKRTRGFVNADNQSATKGCAFNYSANVRTYGACLLFDKIEDQSGQAVRYLEASFEANQVTAKFDPMGQKFLPQIPTSVTPNGSTTTQSGNLSGIKIRINNWQGTVLPNSDLNSTPSYKLSDGKETLDGNQALPWPQEYSSQSQIFK